MRILTHVLQALRAGRHAVKVATDADVAVADEFAHVLDVVSDVAQRGRRGVLAVCVLGVEGDHDDAVVSRKASQHVVRDVARVSADGEGRRVGEDDGRARDVQGVALRVEARVREVHDQARAVHLAHQPHPGRRQAPVQRPAHGLRAVGIPVVAGVRQRGVAHAQAVIHAQDARAVADLVQALDAQHARDLRCVVSPEVGPDLRGRRGQDQLVRELLHESVHEVDLLKRVVYVLVIFFVAEGFCAASRAVRIASATPIELRVLLGGGPLPGGGGRGEGPVTYHST